MSNSEKIVSLKSAKRKPKEAKAEKEQVSKQNLVHCSFCGRPNTEVIKMVKGPGVNICSECTLIAVQYLIMSERVPADEVQKIVDMLWKADKK